MAYEFKIIQRVEFCDTDMAGIVHYANFFRYMDATEHAFFRSLGFSIWTQQVEPPVGWPRVRAQCDFKQPLRFEDEVEVHLLVSEKKAKSLSYIFKFHKVGATPAVEIARGHVTAVCVTAQQGRMRAATIPKAVADKIEVAPLELLA
jgi:YbgC/YbaW family acyl-CoA thioester hydrolase